MTKYKEYVNKMLDANAELFESFKQLHDRYGLEQEKYQEEFNSLGGKVMKVIKEYEDRLCRQSEKGGYGVFTGKLAEKFQEEVRSRFPMIDHVGLKVSGKDGQEVVQEFTIKKISL